jgi:hypothetical protein
MYPLLIRKKINGRSLSKCYHHPQLADTLLLSLNPQPADILPLLPFTSLYINFLLFVLLVYTNLFQNMIIPDI